jgi:hypothetical protein
MSDLEKSLLAVGVHDWFRPAFLEYDCCRKCGIVRRKDDRNGPCRGRIVLSLRDDYTEGAAILLNRREAQQWLELGQRVGPIGVHWWAADGWPQKTAWFWIEADAAGFEAECAASGSRAERFKPGDVGMR